MADRYDLIVVGTGFAGSFFLMRYLERAPSNASILILERGRDDTKAWQLTNRRTSSIAQEEVLVNPGEAEHQWMTSPGFGGNSKCWFAATMRMMPNDFKLKSRYGVGYDWPVSYDDLEKHYVTAERIMSVSGGTDSPMRRSAPFPLPPHRFSTPDELLKKGFPDGWFHPATARASAPTGQRGICCASGMCSLCPTDAKFTIQNGMASIYDDPRITLKLESEVTGIDTAGNTVKGVHYESAGRSEFAAADLVVLGASALFNPHIMLRSGMSHPLLGRRLHEQLSMGVVVDLANVKAYNGSTVISGNGYIFYDGEHRRDHAACMIELWTSPFPNHDFALRTERGRWSERQFFEFVFDEIPRNESTVTVNAGNPRKAQTNFAGYSDYARRGAAQIPSMLDRMSASLPIERVVRIDETRAIGHIQGTTVMGDDPQNSIVDRYLVHHQIRNLLVLGSGAFPTATPVSPTLTICAMSLWAADHLLAKGAV